MHSNFIILAMDTNGRLYVECDIFYIPKSPVSVVCIYNTYIGLYQILWISDR